MRARAIADLTQLSDPEFFVEVSTGMRAVLKNACGLLDDALVLRAAGRHRAEDLLLRIAEEEAAKYHILLDAIRTDRKGPTLARQLRRFNDHLAKGLYAEYVKIAPASFDEVVEFLDSNRQSLFLDGPNDVDWIFSNSILREREEALYVDYIANGGDHLWVAPSVPVTAGMGFLEPRSVALASRLNQAGLDAPAALSVIAGIWRGSEFKRGDHWQRCHELNRATLRALADEGLLTDEGREDASRIAWDWLFPLHSADLSRIEIHRRDLEAQQRAWHPEY